MRSTKCHWCGEDYNDCNRCTHRGVYVEPERLALLERCAEKWAKSAVRIVQLSCVEWHCDSCGRCNYSYEVTPLHAHDCDAAKILGLEREGEG